MAEIAKHSRAGYLQRDITQGLEQRADLAFSQEELKRFASAHDGAGESFSDVETTGRNAQDAAITQFSSAKPVQNADSSYSMQLLDLFILPFRPIYQEYLQAKKRHEEDPEHYPAPIYDRRLYEYQIDSEALAVTGTRFIREEGENSPIIGMVLEPREPKTGEILEHITIDDPLTGFADALPVIEKFIHAKHDLYYNAPFDKAFLRQKALDVLAYQQFCEQRDAGDIAEDIPLERIAARIAENKENLANEPTLFDPDARDWQCLLHGALVADSGHPANRLDDTFRRLVDPDFTERKAHDAAEDIAMSAKVAMALHERFEGDIPDFIDLWQRLIKTQCANATIQAETYEKEPFETRSHFNADALKPFGDSLPSIHIHLLPAPETQPVARFFGDLMRAKERNAGTIGFILDCQTNAQGTDIWLNPAMRDGKPLIAGLIKKFQLFADAVLAEDDERIVEDVRLYDSVSKCDVRLRGSDRFIQNVPLASLHHNLSFLSNPKFSVQRREQVVEMMAELCKHSFISNSFIETNEEGSLVLVLKGTIPNSGDIRFALGQIENPLEIAFDVLTYLDKMAKVGLLEGTQEARYQFEPDDENDDLEREDSAFGIDVAADSSLKQDETAPLRLALSPTVSALVKRQLGERMSRLNNVATTGLLKETEQGTLVFEGNLSNVDKAVKGADDDSPLRFAEVLRNASWLNYRLKKIADVNEVVSRDDAIVLRCHNGISQRTLFTLYRAAIPFSIRADAKDNFTEITLDQDALFRDAFNASKQLKEATSDINDFYAQDLSELPKKSDSLIRKKFEHFSHYQPDMAMLADSLRFGLFSQLRVNQSGHVYFQTNSDTLEHRFIPPGQSERIKLSAPDGILDPIESTVIYPYIPIKIDIADASARFIFTDRTPISGWFKRWLQHHDIAFAPESEGNSIILAHKEDFARASEGLATLTQHYYRLYRHSGSLPLISDVTEKSNQEAANHRILQLSNARFPRSGNGIDSIQHSINQLGQSLEAIKEKINNLTILRANFVNEMDGSPLLSDEDIRRVSSLLEIEKKLRSRKERLNDLDQLSGLLDAEHGCRHSIAEHLRLSKTPPNPVKSALKEHISWLSQLSDAARLCGCTKQETDAIDSLLATLARAQNSAERLDEAANSLEDQASNSKNGLMRLYANVALLTLPDTIATAIQKDKKTDKAIHKLREILRHTHVQLNGENDDKAVGQIINHSIAEHLLFWSSPKNQQDWQQRHPDVDWQQVATTLLTEAFSPALQQQTAEHLVRLCCKASNLHEVKAWQDELWNVANKDERKLLESQPLGETFFDALLVMRGIASLSEIGESCLRAEIADIEDHVKKAYKHRATQYGYLIDDIIRKKDAALDTELAQLREKARHCWVKAGLSEEEANQKVTAKRKGKKPFSDSNVSVAKEKQAEIEAGTADWQKDPAAYIDCEGAEEALVAQLEEKAEKTAISYIRKISKSLPDPFRELKMARRMVRKHGNIHEGFIKEWNDFDAILTHTVRHLQQAQFMLGLHPEQSQQKGAFPLSEPYVSFQQAMQHIQQHYAESVRNRLSEKGFPFSETSDQEHIRWDIDLTQLLSPQQQAETDYPKQTPEPTGWEEGWERHFITSDSLLANVPESLRSSLKPLTEIIEAFSKLGQVSIPEVTLKIDAHGESEAIILEAVQSTFKKILNPMARKMGHEAVPELSYDAKAQSLKVRFSMDQAASIVQTAAFATEQHQALSEPRTKVENPVLFRRISAERPDKPR